jgi:hypothetical protein
MNEWKTLLKRLRDNDPTLVELEFHPFDIDDEKILELIPAIKDNKWLKKFYLHTIDIDDTSIKELLNALINNSVLWPRFECLELWSGAEGGGGEIRDEGARKLAIALRNNHSLTKLELYAQGITTTGIKELADALKDNHPLTELKLPCNFIVCIGAKALAAVLNQNSSLLCLDLSGNRIGPEGAKSLATALKDNQTLIELALHSNDIGNDGADELAIALKNNYTLLYITLSNRSRSAWDKANEYPAIKEIRAIINRNFQLRDKMHEAVKKGDISAFNQYMQQGVSLLVGSGNYVFHGSHTPNYYLNNRHNTALHWAVIAKQYNMTAHLINMMNQRGMTLDKKNRDNKTAGDLAKGTRLETLFTSVPPTLFFSSPASIKNSEMESNNMREYKLTSKL